MRHVKGLGVVLTALVVMLLGGVADAGHFVERPNVIQVSAGLSVHYPELGVFERQPGGGVAFKSKSRFQMKSGATYGWRMKVEPRHTTLKIKEVMTLPSAPASWGFSNQVTISHDRRTSTLETSLPVDKDGYVYNFWTFSEGDPTGTYHFDIYAEDTAVGRLEFEVK
mgnify:CR=1 FL=1